MDYDHTKFVNIEISIEEIVFIRELLRYEAMYQAAIYMKENDETNRLAQVTSVFDNYRYYDDLLKDFRNCLEDSIELDKQEGIKSQNLVLMDRPTANFYYGICKHTPKLNLTSELRVKSDRFLSNILYNFDLAIQNYDALNADNSDIKINILGVQGRA